MRPLVEGTVAQGQLREDDAMYRGKSGEEYVATVPVPVDDALLQRGQDRYNIYCTPCHDKSGSGHGMIVKRGYPIPIDLASDRVRGLPDGQIFDVITNGVSQHAFLSQADPGRGSLGDRHLGARARAEPARHDRRRPRRAARQDRLGERDAMSAYRNDTRKATVTALEPTRGKRLVNVATALFVVGVLTSILGAVADHHRFAFSYLTGFVWLRDHRARRALLRADPAPHQRGLVGDPAPSARVVDRPPARLRGALRACRLLRPRPLPPLDGPGRQGGRAHPEEGGLPQPDLLLHPSRGVPRRLDGALSLVLAHLAQAGTRAATRRSR